MSEVLTETDGEWAEGNYGDFLGLTTEERAIVERRAERARLEREVIEAAKAEYAAIETYQGNSTIENWNAITVAKLKRTTAVKDLIDFESSQQQIKK